ncbi:4Fe-4S dicluster domain-containing protein [Slackia exigua]|uniref:4Fe-4S dicluster domain-containing protein n=1 Tax=Slackia exigua TaxID=84109 RepID=UPI0028E2D56E|nr:4Fe-4S dicluster domain-containing protein [Slackia exigua]
MNDKELRANDRPDEDAGNRAGSEERSILRRTFFYAIGGIAALAATGAVGVAHGEGDLLRPPGGQDESAFLAGCIRCDKCRSICPTNCVRPGVLEDGFVAYRTPKIDFHRGYCTFCNKCIEVCPIKCLAAFDPVENKIGLAVIDRVECLAYKGSGCQVCVDACQYGAISLDEAGRPVVNTGLCNGCGQCEYECPSASYGSYSGSGVRGINVSTVAAAEAEGVAAYGLGEGSDAETTGANRIAHGDSSDSGA